ncbi:XRE family transcriptional regulator [Nocardia sp. NPDC050435]|uniref:helix-turn-helix domain-containing protein n=1 Tax=Nocardia sp. NPDC050435 TaxID=3155040 RepID=UPI00340ACDF1
MAADDVAETGRFLAERVDYLFRTIHPRGRGPYSHPEVHRATGISIGALSELRTGKKSNPTRDTLQKLAGFFGVNPEIFFDTPRSGEIHQQLEQLRALQKLADTMDASGAENVLTRISELSPSSIQVLTDMIARLHGLERGDQT